jgi:hypothetical protein
MNSLVVERYLFNTMWASEMADTHSGRYELCFHPLFSATHGFRFPCDQCGQVNLNSLSDRMRNNYFYARAMVGRELDVAVVEELSKL